MNYFTDGDEWEGHLCRFFEPFVVSETAAALAAATKQELGADATVRVRTTAPAADLLVDLSARTVNRSPDAEALVEVDADAATFHEFWVGALNPVDIARAFESGALRGHGPAAALRALIGSVGELEPLYRQALRESGRDDLIEATHPRAPSVWTRDFDDRLVGVPRGWQQRRDKANSTTGH